MALDAWTRRDDLEGGKQTRIWLEDDGSRELYVEDLTYRDDGFAVYVYDAADDSWETVGEYDDADAALDSAAEWAERGQS